MFHFLESMPNSFDYFFDVGWEICFFHSF